MTGTAPWKQLLMNSLELNSHLKHSSYFQLATIGTNGRPSNRTVVFRGFEDNTDNIHINTDTRSRKGYSMILRRLAVAFSPLRRRGFCRNSINSQDISITIAELNKEMEAVFGMPPSDGPGSSTSNDFMSQESPSISQNVGEKEVKLTHTGSTGKAQMVDVSVKESTKRTAIASCKVKLGKKVFDLVAANQMAKGDVLSVAKIAGICGAKQTSSLIPLCHNITLTHVQVDLTLDREDCSVHIAGEAASTGKTGVEMEAMTAVTVAGLTVYDMCKAASKDIQITDVRLEHKSGGKSGDWSR